MEMHNPANIEELVMYAKCIINRYKDSTGHKRKVLGIALELSYIHHLAEIPDHPKLGWKGRLWIRYNTDKFDGFGSDGISQTQIRVGTGGFGSYGSPWDKIYKLWHKIYNDRSNNANWKEMLYPRPTIYSWDCKIYEDDFPLLKANVEKDRIISILNRSPSPSTYMIYEWTDEVTKINDEAFIQTHDALYSSIETES